MEDRQNHGRTESSRAETESGLADHHRQGGMTLLLMILSCHDSVSSPRWYKDSSQLASNFDHSSAQGPRNRREGKMSSNLLLPKQHPQHEGRVSTEPCSVRASGGARSCRAEKESNGAERRAARHVLLRDLSAIAALGDLLMVFLGFLFAFWLRFQSGFIPSAAGAHSPASLLSYWNLITLGTVTSLLRSVVSGYIP